MIKSVLCYLPFVACGLTFWTFLGSVKLGVRARAIALMVLLLCASKFVCFRAFGGDPFAPELPEAFIWVWNWAYSGFAILFFFAAGGLFLRWLAGRIWKVDCPRAVWLGVLPVLAWGLAAWGSWNGTKLPGLEEVEVVFADLPAELDGYRIVQISDLHASAAARRWRTEAVVALANAARPDLICLTGDYADGMSYRQWRNVEPLGDLRAKDGVFAVTGNHEYYYDTPAWMLRYRSLANIRFLSNEHVAVRPGLVIAGVDDPVCLKFGFPEPDPDKALAGASDTAFRILLQHRPSVNYARLVGREMIEPVDFQLSGHTHGGISPGFQGAIAKWNGGLVRGLYPPPEGEPTYVSNGAGQWAGFPIRFFNDPTVTVFTLRKRERGSLHAAGHS